MATTPLTTEYLQEQIVEVIPTVYEQNSALTAAGAESVNYGTDVLVQNRVGGANIVGESEAKPVTDHHTVQRDAEEITIAHVIPVTNQFLDREEGREAAADFVRGAAESLILSADIALLHGTNPATGNPYARLSSHAVVPAAGKNFVQEAEESIDEAIVRGLAEGNSDKFALLSDKGIHGIQYAQLNGVPRYIQARKEEYFTLWGSDAEYFSAVGIDGFSAQEEIQNDILSINGDFSNILRAFGPVKIDFFKEATFGDLNLAEMNMVAYRVEQTVRVFNLNPDSFTVVRSA